MSSYILHVVVVSSSSVLNSVLYVSLHHLHVDPVVCKANCGKTTCYFVMANFAKAQLMKYGWTEGKGLGKNEDGITEAIKPALKFDTQGIGHKLSDSDNWWEHAFNKAAKNISVKSQEDGVSISTINKDSNDINEFNKNDAAMPYKNFTKTSTLYNGHLVHEKKKTDREDQETSKQYFQPLTDDELFKACGGRTAHKGARHGLKLNGKLERIARQERALLGIENDGATFNDSSCQETVKGCDRTSRRNEEAREEDSGIDSNGNNVSPPANSSREQPETFVKCRKARRRERKHINNLANQLSISCSITENLVPHDSSKELCLKRKRNKDKKLDTTNSGEGLILEENKDYDMPLEKRGCENVAKRKKFDKCGVHENVKDDTPKCKHFVKCCKKKKKSKKTDRDIEDKCKYNLETEDNVRVNEKKITKHCKGKSRSLEDLRSIENADASSALEKVHRKKDLPCDVEYLFSDIKKFMKHDKEKCLHKHDVPCKKEREEEHVDENSTAKQAHLLNYKICKKKFKKMERARLRKLTENITNNRRDERGEAACCSKKCKKSKAEKKLEMIMQDLMAVSLTDDVTEIVKKKKKKDLEPIGIIAKHQ